MGILLLLTAAALAAATFIEHKYGTPAAKTAVYNAVWFYILNALLVLNFAGVASKRRLYSQRKWGVIMLHYAFAVIMLGAMVTRLTGIEGVVHIREGEQSNTMLTAPDYKTSYTLPFSVGLQDFRLKRYAGSNSPSSFESDVRVERPGHETLKATISMNNVLHVGPWRLYQSSYDTDEQGTVLTANRDLAGTLITYAGYVMLFVGMLLALFHRQSRFRQLARSLGKKGKGAAAAALLAAFLLNTVGTAGAQSSLPPGHPQIHGSSSHPGDPVSASGEENDAVSGATAQAAGTAASEEIEYTPIDRAAEKRTAPRYAVEMAIPGEVAGKFARLMIRNGEGRIEPVDTYATRIVRKIHRNESVLGLDADQVLLGIVMEPYVWSRVPFIRVSNEQLVRELKGTDGHVAFIDVLDDYGNYVLGEQVEAIYAKAPRERSKYDKEVLKLDEKVNILNALFNGQMLAIFPPPTAALADEASSGAQHGAWYSPGDDFSSAFRGQDSMFVTKIFPWLIAETESALRTGQWSSVSEIVGMIATYQSAKASAQSTLLPQRIDAELLYNRMNTFRWCGYFYMTIGLLLVLALIVAGVRGRPLKGLVVGLCCAAGLLFLWHTFGMALRWYIAGRGPWSNAYETMIYVGWMTAVAGLLFLRRSKITFALAVFFAGVLLFVSNLNWMDPEITPLVPVLQSPWLMIHVATVVGSYSFFGVGFLLGFIALLVTALKRPANAARLDGQIAEMTAINEMALTVGLVLMTAGTFLGAVWANESWGRYWGWDPKETWALITVIVYAFVLHARFLPGKFWSSPYGFNVMSVVALGSVLMTFFGVNYYLTGLHSYAGDTAPPALYAIYVAYAVVAVVAMLAWRKR